MGRPSPGLILSVVALFVALSGTALAASRYIITNSNQIKPGAIALRNISASARASLSGSVGPEGPQGPQGQNALANARVFTHDQAVPPNSYFYFYLLCPSDERAIGGGANSTSSGAVINSSFPTDANGNGVGNGVVAAGWRTQVLNLSGGQLTVTYYVVCA
jgi:hypothetical protein